MGLGDAAVAGGSSAEAARWYLAALANAGRPEERHAALLAHGRAALSAGQLEGARKSFARLTDPDEAAPEPVVAWAYNGLGLTLLLAGDLRGGVAAMEQAVLRAPGERRFERNLTRGLAMLTEVAGPGNESAVARSRETGLHPAAPAAGTGSGLPDTGAIEGASTPTVTDGRMEGVRRDPGAVDVAAGEPQAAGSAVAPDAGAGSGGEVSAGSMAPVGEAAPGPPVGETAAAAMVEARPMRTVRDAAAVDVVADDPAAVAEPVAVSAGGAAKAVETQRESAVLEWEMGRVSTAGAGSADSTEVAAGALPPAAESTSLDGVGGTVPEALDGPSAQGVPETAGEDAGAGSPAAVPGMEGAGVDAADDETRAGRGADGSEPGFVDVPDSAPIVVQDSARMEVQVAAFRHAWRAEQLAGRLRDVIDHPIWASEVVSQGETPRLWRVRIGPIPSREEMVELGEALEALGFRGLRLPPAAAAWAAGGLAPLVVVEDGQRFVQVGAYSGRPAAEELAARLALLTDQPAGVSRVEVDGDRTVYRVRVGPLASYEETGGRGGCLGGGRFRCARRAAAGRRRGRGGPLRVGP